VVSLYLETDKGFRGPPYHSSAETEIDGRYHLTVEPGRYFMISRLREVSSKRGPMQPGDMFGVHPQLPIKVTSGKAIITDIEVIELPSHERMSRLISRFATIEGIATDLEGNPVSGLRPCLYESELLLNDPVEIGEPTGLDGRFTVKTTRSGFFHLGARTVFGGPPKSGEPVGYAAEAPENGFELKPGGTISDVRMIVRRAP
jgi:hypothetical protein